MAPVGTQIAAVDAGTARGAEVNGMVLCGSVKSAVCTDGVTESATADGIGHSRWHWPQRMASATADGNSHSGWHRPQRWSWGGHSAVQYESLVGVGGIAREPAGGPVQADDDGMMRRIGGSPADIRSKIRWNIR